MFKTGNWVVDVAVAVLSESPSVKLHLRLDGMCHNDNDDVSSPFPFIFILYMFMCV